MNPGELVALSVFYKDFTNPISLSVKPASNTEFQYVNVASGFVSGVEIEFRKSLNVISENLRDFKFGGNIAFIRSRMDIPSDARYIPEVRTFTGQSPILANANLTYSNPDLGIEGGIAYNYIGRRLANLGDQAPDTYAQPFNTLNVNFGYTFKNYTIKLAGLNLINNNVTESLIYNEQDYITSDYTRGRTFTFGVSYKY
jgi:outer membrane receptor for ferrienterochelin and colicin